MIPSTMDTVSLRIPREAGFLSLLHLVLGGIGLRHNLSFDALDDLQLAVDSILAEDGQVGDELAMGVGISDEELMITLAPLRDGDLKATLLQGSVPAGAESRCMDVCILLESLVDSYEVAESDDGTYGVVLRRRAG